MFAVIARIALQVLAGLGIECGFHSTGGDGDAVQRRAPGPLGGELDREALCRRDHDRLQHQPEDVLPLFARDARPDGGLPVARPARGGLHPAGCPGHLC